MYCCIPCLCREWRNVYKIILTGKWHILSRTRTAHCPAILSRHRSSWIGHLRATCHIRHVRRVRIWQMRATGTHSRWSYSAPVLLVRVTIVKGIKRWAVTGDSHGMSAQSLVRCVGLTWSVFHGRILFSRTTLTLYLRWKIKSFV